MITFDFQNSHLQAQKFDSISQEIDLMELYIKKSSFAKQLKKLLIAVEKDLPLYREEEFGIETNVVNFIIDYFEFGFNCKGKHLVFALKEVLLERDIISTQKENSNNQEAYIIISKLEKQINK